MPEVTVKTTSEDDKPKKDIQGDITDTLKKADEYQKLKEENDKLEAEYLRKQELMAKLKLGGQTNAGSLEKSPEDKDKEEAAEYLKPYNY